MIDPASGVEAGFFGDQYDTAATRAFWPAQLFGRWLIARGLDIHRRFSSTHRHHTPMFAIVPALYGVTAAST
jgi:hypothetical protein